MATPSGGHLQNMLRTAVQSVQWTYSLFWQHCPQRGALIWGDGYYNGAIKTRKTVQPTEVSAEETSLHRSQQLRELYDSLSAGESSQPARRPCAALSPEDLSESEWFYLMCVSFSFAPGVGLPGKAYTRRQHVWLAGAAEIDSKSFSRAILAKSARIQTVVCIPILDGVVEFGSTEKVEEDDGFIQHVKSFFINGNPQASIPLPPKPALSEHSTSNPTTSSGHQMFYSPPTENYVAADKVTGGNEFENEDEDDDDDDEDDDNESVSDPETGAADAAAPETEPSELMQLDMSEDIRFGSPDDGSNNIDSNFGLKAPPFNHSLLPPMGAPSLPQDDTYYSVTLPAIFQNQGGSSPSSSHLYSPNGQSAFAQWAPGSDSRITQSDTSSQWLLKCVLFSVPFLHNKYQEENSPKSRDGDCSSSRLRKNSDVAQDEISANHVLAERRRREKLNERFIILRSLVPFVTKMDKASILGDTIEYVKHLRKKINDLESHNRQLEDLQRTPASDLPNKKKKIAEGNVGTGKNKSVRTLLSPTPPPPPPPPELPSPPIPQAEAGTILEVSIIGSDALIEMQCGNREGLVVDVMQTLRDLKIETTAVLSSVVQGTFVAEIKAKVKDATNGKRVTITEVKRSIKQLLPND